MNREDLQGNGCCKPDPKGAEDETYGWQWENIDITICKFQFILYTNILCETFSALKKNPICADIHWKEYQNTNSFFVAGILFHNISQITFCFNTIKKLYPLANNDIKLKSWLLSSSRQFSFKFLINLLWKEKRGLFVGLIS